MSREVIRTFAEEGETWRLVRTSRGYLIEGPGQRFVTLTPAALDAISKAIPATPTPTEKGEK